jgi:YD repeat-containing protein
MMRATGEGWNASSSAGAARIGTDVGRAFARLVLWCVTFACTANAIAQTTTFYDEQGELKRGSRSITTLGPNLAGDAVDMYTGALSLSRTDIDLPGNDALRVAWGQRINLSRYKSQWDPLIPHLWGIFASGSTVSPVGWVTEGANNTEKNQRCTRFGPPPVTYQKQGTGSVDPDEFWDGHHLQVPGEVDEVLLARDPANAFAPDQGSWPIVTKSHWQIGCGVPLAVGTGEGFMVLSPTGTRYRFDRMVSRPYTGMAGVDGSTGREEIWILPSLVTDRFGNTVTYSYDAANPWRVTSIVASDGRRLDFSYQLDGSYTVTAYEGSTAPTGPHTWSYSADRMQVTLPDQSQWLYTLQLPALAASYGAARGCSSGAVWVDGVPISQPKTNTIKTPSGATVSFVMDWVMHGNSGLLQTNTNPCPTPNYAIKGSTPTFAVWSILSKTITGPGLPGSGWTWNTTWGPHNGSWYCPPGCPRSKSVTVTDPAGNWSQYTFDNQFLIDGEVLARAEGALNGPALQTTANLYTGLAVPTGSSGRSNPPRSEWQIRGLLHRDITQQGAVFSHHVNAFDARGRAMTVAQSSTLGTSRTFTTVYDDKTGPWVINLQASVADSGGAVPSATSYTAAGLPYQTFAFGKLQATYDFNANGTLNWIRDGGNNTTSFANYMRGLAQSITYADGTTSQASVNGMGQITSVTNEAGATTAYAYDAMGRLAGISHPNEPAGTSNSTLLAFEQVWSDESGLGAGHWRHTVSTGNARKISYFDALWRPMLTSVYDAADEANTRSMVLRYFDSDGRNVFESYTARSIASVWATPYGVATSYDALGRITRTLADSELGWLTTSVAYQGGLQTVMTNPRGLNTTTTYRAFNDPGQAQAVAIDAPEGVRVDISRDVFDKPVSITRSGGGKSAARNYVYDNNQLLCKTVEPESGATLVDYDGAGNISWKAVGTTLTGLNCDRASAPANRKISHTYDTRNRLTSTSYGDGSPGVTRSYTPDGLLQQIVTQHLSNPIGWTYSYNNRRLLTRERYTWGDPNGWWDFSWTVDANGHVSALTDPWGAMNYSPNALGQATQVSGYASGVTYHPTGAVNRYTLANGLTHTTALNLRGLPDRITNGGITKDAYSFDANGNVTAITDEQEGINPAACRCTTDWTGCVKPTGPGDLEPSTTTRWTTWLPAPWADELSATTLIRQLTA